MDNNNLPVVYQGNGGGYNNNNGGGGGAGTAFVTIISLLALGGGGYLLYKAGAFDALTGEKTETKPEEAGTAAEAAKAAKVPKTFKEIAEYGFNLVTEKLGFGKKTDETVTAGPAVAFDVAVQHPAATNTTTGAKAKLSCNLTNKRVLSNGSSGNDVKQLQACLNKNASKKLVEDGKFGPLTATELMAQTGYSYLDV